MNPSSHSRMSFRYVTFEVHILNPKSGKKETVKMISILN
jgi:hypothetical protein